jgi:DnaK suppressor protein
LWGPHGILSSDPRARRESGGDIAHDRRQLFGEDETMTTKNAKQLERSLLAERARLERELERLTTPPTDAEGGHGRLADDQVESSAGASAEVDRAIAVLTSRELADVDRALDRLHEDPAHFGVCETCARPIPLERLRLVPGSRYCRTHAPL